jgi:hypothetical protein
MVADRCGCCCTLFLLVLFLSLYHHGHLCLHDLQRHRVLFHRILFHRILLASKEKQMQFHPVAVVEH